MPLLEANQPEKRSFDKWIKLFDKTQVEIFDDQWRSQINELKTFAEKEKIELDRHREFEIHKAWSNKKTKVKEIAKSGGSPLQKRKARK